MKRLLPQLWAKIIAFILFFVMAALCILSAVGTVYLAMENAYFGDAERIVTDDLQDRLYNKNDLASWYVEQLIRGETDSAEELYRQELSPTVTNYCFRVYDDEGLIYESPGFPEEGSFSYSAVSDHDIALSYSEQVITETFFSYEAANSYVRTLESSYNLRELNMVENYDENTGEMAGVTVEAIVDTSEYKIVTVKGYLPEKLTVKDDFYNWNKWLGALVDARYTILILCVLSFVGAVLLFIFLMCSAGHKAGEEGIHIHWFARIPLDLMAAGILIFLLVVIDAMFYGYYGGIFSVLIGITSTIILGFAFLMSFAAWVKRGKWWQNTVIYMILRLCIRFFRWLLRALPLVWRVAVVTVGVMLVEFICICFVESYWWFGSFLAAVILVLLNVGILVFLIYTAINMLTLKKAGEHLATGDFTHKVDTSGMFLDIKAHGENLNRIGEGISRAVNQQMKSERMKTELITNVSHDIKTPLTSIVNYVDLLKKEEISPAKAREYVEVLDRQSARMKKLIEDLVEVSKASTGNVAVTLEKTNLGVLLSQAVGEYEQKLRDKNLELIMNLGDQPRFINADGTLLWRVFDNLLGNICKYAMEGTRVYLTLETAGKNLRVSFKNVSKYALNITSDELMERFVRGDRSRNTEGSGLGLSIAQSLTALQNGTLTIVVDGDLFKAQVEFEEVK